MNIVHSCGYIREVREYAVKILRKLTYTYNKILNNQISINGHKHIYRHSFIYRDVVDISRCMETYCQNFIEMFISHNHIIFMDEIDIVERFLQIIDTYGFMLYSDNWN